MDKAKTGYLDYYYILGVGPDATSREIQEAYEELYERFGPHVQHHGQETGALLKAYKDICEAYEVLMDAEKRKAFDETHWRVNKSNLRGVWEKSLGPEGAGGGQREAIETREDVEVSLRQVIKGFTHRMRVDEQLPCKSCTTLKPVQRLKCDNCRGLGYTHNARYEDLAVEPGAFDRMQKRFAGRGKFDSRANRYGDIVLSIKIKPHQFFNVMGMDLACTVPITILEAVLGGEIEVPTATGKVFMKLQPLTQTGRLYRLKGLGLSGADLLVTVQVVIPNQISGDELELYRKLHANSTIKNPRAEIFQKLTDSTES